MSDSQMPFQIGWYLDKRILYAHLDRQLQSEEANTFNVEMTKIIRRGEAPVFLIMDLRDVHMTTAPKISRLNQLGYRAEKNLRWMISIIDSDRVLNFVVSTATQIAGTSYKTFDQLNDAIDFVKQRLGNEIDWSTIDSSVLHTID